MIPSALRCTAAPGAVAALLLLAGCAAPALTHGTITAKQYKAATTHMVNSPVYGTRCSGSGTMKHCYTAVTAWIPEQRTTPECYSLALRAGKRTGSVCVSPAEYAAATVGAKW